jgi:putative intracellular protease/amidase
MHPELQMKKSREDIENINDDSERNDGPISRRKFGQLFLATSAAIIAGTLPAVAEQIKDAPQTCNAKFEIIIFDGFDDIDGFGVLESLRLASCSVKFKSLRKQDFVTTASGVKIIPAGTYDLQNPPDVLIVPGGGWPDPNVGAYAEAKRGEILEVIRQFHSQGKNRVLASVCIGSLLLGKAGVLKDRPATCNRGFFEELKGFGANLIEARVVDDGEIITAGGITASFDLGLWLVQRFCGPEKAIYVSNQLEFESRGPIWQRPR